MKRQARLLILARIAVVAGIYFVATYFLPGLSYGQIQFRVSEGMTILPLIFPETVWGLTLGCLISNIFSPYGWLDMVLGTTATLIGSLGAVFLGKILKNSRLRPFVSMIPMVVANALILPVVWLLSGTEDGYFVMVASTFVSETVSVYLVGMPLYYTVSRIAKDGRFKN